MITPDQKFIWSPGDVIDAAGGWLVHGKESGHFDAIIIDSRNILPGTLFVAIVGEKLDGHDYIPDAIAKAARGVVAAEHWFKERAPDPRLMGDTIFFAVADTTHALGDLAAYQRRLLPAKVVAITGSNGKTTTRRMTAAVMDAAFPTLSTSGNLNNHIGLPLTLFNLQPHHQWAVVEIGMNHFGEIARLSEICQPDIGLITNIAPSHLEGVGDIAGVLKAKSEIVKGLNSGGVMVLNADDQRLQSLAARITTPVVTFGLDEAATIQAREVRATPQGFRFTLCAPGQQAEVRLQTPGRFMVSNALAAAAVGWQAGIALIVIAETLSHFEPLEGRLQIIATAAGVTLIDDTYNANPGSVAAAVATFKELAPAGRKFMVLGDMLELGEHTRALHREVGALIGACHLDGLFLTGTMADAVAAGARKQGMPAQQVVTAEKSGLTEKLKALLRPGDYLLIKGSRGMAMETVLKALLEWAHTPTDTETEAP